MVAKKFLESKPNSHHTLTEELNSLRSKGIVSTRKNEDFHDCELGLSQDEINSIDLEKNEDEDTQNK